MSSKTDKVIDADATIDDLDDDLSAVIMNKHQAALFTFLSKAASGRLKCLLS